jgi:lipopolysaccharide/colanic/teichoic acid biosynthesis glycosyltransferase
MAKRWFDIVLASLGLLLLSPLLLAIAVWIKLDSTGPVLFRQERVGRFGVRVDAPALGSQLTVGADPRITRAGRVLRAAKLDELPQLIDVLAGTMSLVGPRPEVPRYVAMYPPALRDKVLSVRPGITDPASIEYRDESTLLARAADPERVYVEQVLPAKLQFAAQYVDRMSLRTDVHVIVATLRALWVR